MKVPLLEWLDKLRYMKIEKNKHILISNSDNQSYDIFYRDSRGGLTFHSRYDNYDEALREKENLDSHPSQLETINMVRDLRNKLK